MKKKNIDYSYDDYIYNEIDALDSIDEGSAAKIYPDNDFEDEFYENYMEDIAFSDGDSESDTYDYDYDQWIE